MFCSVCGKQIDKKYLYCPYCGKSISVLINTTYQFQKEFDIRNNVLIKYNGCAKEVIIPNGVTTIRRECFSGELVGYIEKIIVPSSVEIIENGAFYCHNLRELDIRAKIRKLDDWFEGKCDNLECIKNYRPINVECTGK